MLWTASQDRQQREHRARLVDLFLTARDAELDVGVATGRLKPVGTWHQPWYVTADRSDQPQVLRTPAQRDMALAYLEAQGMLRRGRARSDA